MISTSRVNSGRRGGWGRRFRDYPRRLLALAAAPRVRFVAVSQAIRRRAIAFGVPAEKIDVRHIGVDLRRFAPSGRPIAERAPQCVVRRPAGREERLRASGSRDGGCSTPRAPSGQTDGHRRRRRTRLPCSGSPLTSASRRYSSGRSRPPRWRASSNRRASSACRASPRPTATQKDFGQVLLEAQACGVPVVTSARGGAEEGICDGVTGFAFAEGDEFTLADRLTRILVDDAPRRRRCRPKRRASSPAFRSRPLHRGAGNVILRYH